MGYKILDVKVDIHEGVEKYFNQLLKYGCLNDDKLKGMLQEDILDIVDEHFEKIER